MSEAPKPLPTPEAVLATLSPLPDDSHRERGLKLALGARMAQAFLDAGNGQGFEAALAVLLSTMTDPKVRVRVRARAAEAFASLSIKASALLGPRVAVQINNGVPAGAPGDPRRTAEFWQGAMADPTARAELLAGLSATVGAPPPVNATTVAKPAAAPVVEDARPRRRRTSKPADREAGAA